MTSAVFKIDGEHIDDCLHVACAKVGEGETVLDFSGVRRIDPKAVRALEELVNVAEARGVKVGVCGVNVEIYKVLKLVKLASRINFSV